MQRISNKRFNQGEEFDKVAIKIASPDRVRAWSNGEVKRSETINYRTAKPEKDGLFCEKIFGTTKEWECYCGKFKSIRYQGVVCERCGVEVSSAKVRRERVGHIELASPVAHIWFYGASPSRIGVLLDITSTNLKSILYYEKYIVLDPGNTDLKKMQILSEEEFYKIQERFGQNSFNANMGAEAIKILLRDLDLEELSQNLRSEMLEKGKKATTSLLKRLRIIEDFKESGNKPEWMILDVISVIPPDLRPMVKLDGGRFATSDLNDLYRRVINRNNRIKRLLDLKAPDIIIRNEKRMLQESVDALFDNSKKKKVGRSGSTRTLRSFTDVLKGKQGRFRQNLLGKRVDYSGRSVIIIGPELRLNQCGLPIKMALELFKPFIIQKLVANGLVHNIKRAKILAEQEAAEVFEILEEVVLEHPVLLNRAPTLHRLGIQAFEPVLVSGKAIRLHPLVCVSFNADFDGDQMPVHVPLTQAAQIECWTLMLSSRNILNPANGSPIVLPSQDMVLGIYYLTKERIGDEGEGKYFSSKEEVIYAIENNYISYHALIKIKNKENQWFETTPGRIIFNEVFPKGMDFVNETVNDSKLKSIVFEVYTKEDSNVAVEFLDRIKAMGFKYATIFGATISVGDMIIPDDKEKIIKEANEKVLKVQKQFTLGTMTEEQRYNNIIDIWSIADGELSKIMMEEFRKDKNGFNSIHMIVSSGARGSERQIKQLAGMRGLMSKPSGDIIELPIKSNFKEGLSAMEFFISSSGARKGLSDTALKTSNAGYLTRRLVDVAQDVVVTIDDCGTINGIETGALKDGEDIVEKLSSRIEGRFTIERIKDPITEDIILDVNEEITLDKALEIEESGIDFVKIRTVLTCESRQGVCVKCYGKNLASGKIVSIGEAVGITAAQSIGQPGTQLTMRTFHVGGTASKITEDNKIALKYPSMITKIMGHIVETEENEKIFASKGYIFARKILDSFKIEESYKLKVKNEAKVFKNQVIFEKPEGQVLANQSGIAVIQDNNIYLCSQEQRIEIKNGSFLLVKEKAVIDESATIVTFDQFSDPIIAEYNGVIKYKDIEKNLKEERGYGNAVEKRISNVLVNVNIQPKILIVNSKGEELGSYDLPSGATLSVADGEEVKKGRVLAKIPKGSVKTSDITGGLPRINDLFEARPPKNSSVLAMVSGYVEDVKVQSKLKRIISVKDSFGEVYNHEVDAGKYILVRKGDLVEIGEPLSDGDKNPHSILRILGDSELHSFLLNEIQSVYNLQGIEINDKHISVIIRQMLKKVEIKDVGDTKFILKEQVDKYDFFKENKRVLEKGGRPSIARSIMLGISKAALNNNSFLSAASFQETSDILTTASIKGSVDELEGLKENIIVGRLIPAGTGMRKYKNIKLYDENQQNIDLYVKSVVEARVKENKTEEVKVNFTLDEEE